MSGDHHEAPPPPLADMLWTPVARDIRTFLAMTTKHMGASFESMWTQIEADYDEGRDPTQDGPRDLFAFWDRFGLLEQDYTWMLLSGVLRDAVTAFEVYLEQAAEAVLLTAVTTLHGDRVRLKLKVAAGHGSASWPVLLNVHRALGSDVATPKVEHIRSLRHLLTHQRGQLRTTEQRDTFAQERGNSPAINAAFSGVSLSESRVEEMIDSLSDVVRTCDTVCMKYYWQEEPLPMTDLLALTEGNRPSLVVAEA